MTLIIKSKLHGLPKYEVLWILELENYILNNLSKRDLKISRVSKHFGLSERQFYRRVKKVIQMTPNNLIRLIRLETAKKYLEEGEFATISEVSHAIGYSRSDYFSDLFYEHYGIRPIDYKS